MRILIVGNGGREHAILWKLHRDVPEAEFFITRGNGGTGSLATAIPFDPTEMQSLAGWALEERVDLTVVGPDLPLALGIVDHFTARGLRVFGPSKAAAEIESSKAFAKRLMERRGIPTARFEVFAEADAATEFACRMGGPLVVKASGLAAGKGAVVCETTDEAIAAIKEIFGGAFGAAGENVVVEEFMEGEELSVFALADGGSVLTLLAVQDHKRVGEGDTGPNTGGMGAYAPVSIATPDLLTRIEDDVLRPVVAALAEEGRPYKGVLYAGLMITPAGPKVVEFNARFGDPEAQVLLPLLQTSLYRLMTHVVDGTLEAAEPIQWRSGAAVTTILASSGYPGAYQTGYPIEIPADLVECEDLLLFHAGTTEVDGRLVTSGGRVMAVTALAESFGAAAEQSRAAAERITFPGRFFRRDIGWREARRVND
jgi:phosphoribosylamine---glycine ligase